MIPRLFGCRKFRRLANEKHDRDLTWNEKQFLERHRLACHECRRAEYDCGIALNMLRDAVLEPTAPSAHFEERIIRRLRVQRARDGVGYWTPALMGAVVAGFAVLAALQLVVRSNELPHVKLPGAVEALRNPSEGNPQLPNLIIEGSDATPRVDRNGS